MRESCQRLWCALALILGTGAAFAGPVDINTADAETLAAELTGIGPALAAAIVRDRQTNGAFPDADSLTRVKGIGERIVAMNREYILVGDSPREP